MEIECVLLLSAHCKCVVPFYKSALSSAMSITTLTIPMGKITAPRAGLPRAASILHEDASAVLALN